MTLPSDPMDRRRWLECAASLGAAALGCGSRSVAADDGAPEPTGDGNRAADGSCLGVPDETAGPFPGNGSNGPNALALTDIVRRDIRSSVGGASATAGGVALTLALRLMDSACAPRPGLAVYVWHCDREARYSMYSAGAENENYLRGVQVADADGAVTFTTVFPACYSGRWPHIHFEIYDSAEAAASGSPPLKVSQLALPESACRDVFATAGYEASVSNLSRISLATDGVFRDGAALELAGISGDVGAGLVARLDVAVPV
ncbi:MAG TPA: hypothetical protein VNN80_13630 [Polyangiaceae bacterium]|nr:hypothetical protein [Polyangiaceae bacterium]